MDAAFESIFKKHAHRSVTRLNLCLDHKLRLVICGPCNITSVVHSFFAVEGDVTLEKVNWFRNELTSGIGILYS